MGRASACFITACAVTGLAFVPPLIPPSCPQFPSRNGPGVLCEDFDTQRNGAPGFQWSRLAVAADPTDPLVAIGDPNDDVLGYTQSAEPAPLGVAGRLCATGRGAGHQGCQTAVAEENDWHLHSPHERPDATYDPRGFLPHGAPGGAKAHSGIRSLHWGRHTDPTSTFGDTVRFRQVSAFVLEPAINPGPDSRVDFWQIISVPDDENLGSGFIPAGRSFGGGQVQISLLGDNGRFERWRPLNADFNGYDSAIQTIVSICQFDPDDDETPPLDDTMCDGGPVWADLGDVIGTDATCTADTDSNDPLHKDCGAISSCAGGPGCTERGSVGTGVWARSSFSLSPFAGRQARLRWIASMGGGWSFGTDRSFMENPTIYYLYFDADDGWWVDDIVLTDLRDAPQSCDTDADQDGHTICERDCNDANPTVYPGAPQLCDDLNNNCDDPRWPATAGLETVDDDGDGFSDCQQDCDDTRASVFPGATQTCDGINNDCADPGWPAVPASERDADWDGYRVCGGDCDDTSERVRPGFPQVCDGINNDCNDPSWPELPAAETDADGDGYRPCNGDCDDARAEVRPGAPQICGDGLNNSCNHPNWPELAGTNEVDDDGDGLTECAGDCDDSRADTWAPPGEPQDLEVTLLSNGWTLLSWSAPADPGGTATRYDLLKSGSAVEFSQPGACVNWDSPHASATDTAVFFEEIVHYLVRSENSCGVSPLTRNSEGTSRSGRACP